MSIGKRLREERERLGFSQPAFAAIAGTTKQTLFSWETDKTAPDAAQLAELAIGGTDVLYVLIGQRSQAIPPQQALPRDKQALLNSYDMCETAEKKHLLQTAALLASGAKREAIPAQREVGGDNIQVGRGAIVSRSFMGVAIGGRSKKKD